MGCCCKRPEEYHRPDSGGLPRRRSDTMLPHPPRLVFLNFYTALLKDASDRLAEYDLQLSDCTNINIFLSSIDLFSRVNAVYATFFGTSPPARACVAIDLPHPISVRLDCTAFIERTNTDRQALHVQGLSYWAPANIGPYSQAITVRITSTPAHLV